MQQPQRTSCTGEPATSRYLSSSERASRAAFVVAGRRPRALCCAPSSSESQGQGQTRHQTLTISFKVGSSAQELDLTGCEIPSDDLTCKEGNLMHFCCPNCLHSSSLKFLMEPDGSLKPERNKVVEEAGSLEQIFFRLRLLVSREIVPRHFFSKLFPVNWSRHLFPEIETAINKSECGRIDLSNLFTRPQLSNCKRAFYCIILRPAPTLSFI